jgi:hypothetical protein
MMGKDEILKRCEAVIYRTEAELERRIKHMETMSAAEHHPDLHNAVLNSFRAELAAMEKLRQAVMDWRSEIKSNDAQGGDGLAWNDI